MSAIMGDYVAGFLGASEGCNWNMDAFDVSEIILVVRCLTCRIFTIGYQD